MSYVVRISLETGEICPDVLPILSRFLAGTTFGGSIKQSPLAHRQTYRVRKAQEATEVATSPIWGVYVKRKLE